MSYIRSRIRCDGCGHEMNVAFGIVGMQQIAGWPTKCPKCGASSNHLGKIADSWDYTPVTQTGVLPPSDSVKASTTATEDTLRTLRFTLLTIGYGPFMEGIASERAKGKQELAVQLLKAIDESASTTAESEKADPKAIEEIRIALVSAERWLSDFGHFGAAATEPRTVHKWTAALRLAFNFMSELSASETPVPAGQTEALMELLQEWRKREMERSRDIDETLAIAQCADELAAAIAPPPSPAPEEKA